MSESFIGGRTRSNQGEESRLSQDSPTPSSPQRSAKEGSSPSSLSKDQKKRAIKNLLRQKLDIVNIYDIEIGHKLNFDNGLTSPSTQAQKGASGFGFGNLPPQGRLRVGPRKTGLRNKILSSNYNSSFGVSRRSDAALGGGFGGLLDQNGSNNGLSNYEGIIRKKPSPQKLLAAVGPHQPEKSLKFRDLYHLKGILGHGSYGVVLLVTNVKANEQRALKIVYKSRLSEQEVDILKQESEILQRISAPRVKSNVVQSFQMFESETYIFIEMEYIQGDQLKKIYDRRLTVARSALDGGLTQEEIHQRQFQELLKRHQEAMNYDDQQSFDLAIADSQDQQLSSPLFSEEEASKVLKGILQGLTQVHGLDIIHRDLKPENIMIRNEDLSSEAVVIVDFGLSAKFKATEKFALDDKIGTILFMAPEQISNQSYGKKIDIYASGIILYYFLCGKHPLYQFGDTQITYRHKVAHIEPERWSFPPFVSQLARDLICRLCKITCLQRYDAKRALQHPFITRNLEDKIPLNRKEETQYNEAQTQLKRVSRIAAFLSMIKAHNLQNQKKSSGDNLASLKPQSSMAESSGNAGDQAYFNKLRKEYRVFFITKKDSSSDASVATKRSELSDTHLKVLAPITDSQPSPRELLLLPSIFKRNGDGSLAMSSPDKREFVIKKRNTGVTMKEIEASIKKRQSEQDQKFDVNLKSASDTFTQKQGQSSWAMPSTFNGDNELLKKPLRGGGGSVSKGSPLKIPSGGGLINEAYPPQSQFETNSPVKARHNSNNILVTSNMPAGGPLHRPLQEKGSAGVIDHFNQVRRSHVNSIIEKIAQEKSHHNSSSSPAKIKPGQPSPYVIKEQNLITTTSYAKAQTLSKKQTMAPHLQGPRENSMEESRIEFKNSNSQSPQMHRKRSPNRIEKVTQFVQSPTVSFAEPSEAKLSLRLTQCLDDQDQETPFVLREDPPSHFAIVDNYSYTLSKNSGMPPILPSSAINAASIRQFNSRAYRNASNKDPQHQPHLHSFTSNNGVSANNTTHQSSLSSGIPNLTSYHNQAQMVQKTDINQSSLANFGSPSKKGESFQSSPQQKRQPMDRPNIKERPQFSGDSQQNYQHANNLSGMLEAAISRSSKKTSKADMSFTSKQTAYQAAINK